MILQTSVAKAQLKIIYRKDDASVRVSTFTRRKFSNEFSKALDLPGFNFVRHLLF